MIATLLLCALPAMGDPLVENVDLIEVNHLFDDEGRAVFTSVIFWRWYSDDRFHVVDWRYQAVQWKPPGGICNMPDYIYRQRFWRVRWVDGDVLREVRAPCFRETWTQEDPEVLDRDFLPQQYRMKLIKTKPGLQFPVN